MEILKKLGLQILMLNTETITQEAQIQKKDLTILKNHKILKKLQSLHEANFSVHEHWTTSLENVPATAKQTLPPFFPPFIPLKNSSTAARQIPSSATFSPPGSLPQFIYSQQFCFFETNSIIPIYLEIRGVANITNCEKTSKIKIDCRYQNLDNGRSKRCGPPHPLHPYVSNVSLIPALYTIFLSFAAL